MINLEKLDRLAGLVFQNCLRLHLDSITLFKNRSYPSAYFISILALEEFGKIFWIEDALWHSAVEGMWSKEESEKWLGAIFVHTYKQKTFAHHLSNNLPKKYISTINSGKLDTDKQNAIYVGLPKNKRKINIDGRIINPLSITLQKAEKQITIMNDCVLENILGNIKGVYSFQSNAINELMTRKLYVMLSKKWKLVSLKVQRRIYKLEQF